MNKEDIIKLALDNSNHGLSFDVDGLIRFAKLIAEHEREACAELCEMLDVANPKGKSWDEGTIDCANAIRARGKA
jgi:hypothetical protein